MWTERNRARHDREGLRYPSALTDEEWALVEPEIPPAKRDSNRILAHAGQRGVQHMRRRHTGHAQPIDHHRAAAAGGGDHPHRALRMHRRTAV